MKVVELARVDSAGNAAPPALAVIDDDGHVAYLTTGDAAEAAARVRTQADRLAGVADALAAHHRSVTGG